MDMVDPQPTLVQFLIRHVLLPRALLPQIEINSIMQWPHGRNGDMTWGSELL
jgi:hypothetical protein